VCGRAAATRVDDALRDRLHPALPQQRREQFMRRMPSRPFCEIAVNTSMFGMPVVKYAVLTSPHGMPTARRSPAPKSILRVCEPSSTGDDLAVAPHARAAADGFDRGLGGSLAHPGVAFEAEREMRASGSAASISRRRCRSARRRSRRRAQHDLRAMRFVIDAVRQLEDFDLAGDVEIVNVRGETALHHRPRRRGEGSAQCRAAVMPSSARTSDV
jgi:hypothetical protein